MGYSVVFFLRQYRRYALALLDGAAWMVAVYAATGFRLQTWNIEAVFQLQDAGTSIPLWGVVAVGAAAAALHLAIATVLHLHDGRVSIGSFDDLSLLVGTVLTVGVVVYLGNVLMLPRIAVPRLVPPVAAIFVIAAAGWCRALWRQVVNNGRAAGEPGAGTPVPVIVVGAGQAARQLIASMLGDHRRTWRPVAMVDDDPRKRHFRTYRVPVAGTIDQLPQVAAKLGVSVAVIAIPSASLETRRRIFDVVGGTSLDVKVLPGVQDLDTGNLDRAVRDVAPEDLLGRHQVQTDVEVIADSIRGKRILVTGAGGSIGSELVRQITGYAPAEVALLDRDESALHTLLLSLGARPHLDRPDIVLADVRDAERLEAVFAARRPEVVFHAAALKHVTVLQTQPDEAVKTNVLGTLNVLRAAQRHGVDRFVNISTDKAADPQNVLGLSKRLAEGLTAHIGANSPGTYLSVRFGNVLGTRGSMLETFRAQIEAGGPLTVTDPEATRYFMTVNESVQLVVQAAAVGRSGEALVLDMGRPVRIHDVARRLAEQSHRTIEIVFTGLRPGESLHEVLLAPGEIDDRPIHPLLSHVRVPPITPDQVAAIDLSGGAAAVIADLERLCAAMRPGAATDGAEAAGGRGAAPESPPLAHESGAHESGAVESGAVESGAVEAGR